MFTKFEKYLISITVIFILLAFFVRFMVYYYPLHVSKNNAQKIVNSDYNEIETISVLRLCLFLSKGSKNMSRAIINSFEYFYNNLKNFRFIYFFNSNEIKSCPYVKRGLKECVNFFRKVKISAENFHQVKDKALQCEEIIKLNCVENKKINELIDKSFRQYMEKEKKFIEINKWDFPLNKSISHQKNIPVEKNVSKKENAQNTQLEKNIKTNASNDKVKLSNEKKNLKETLESSSEIKEDKSKLQSAYKIIDKNKLIDIFKNESKKAGILVKNLKFDDKTSKLTISFESGYIKTEVFAKQLKTIFDMVYRIFIANDLPVNLLIIKASDVDHVLMYFLELDINDLKMYKEGNINSEQFRKRWREKEY